MYKLFEFYVIFIRTKFYFLVRENGLWYSLFEQIMCINDSRIKLHQNLDISKMRVTRPFYNRLCYVAKCLSFDWFQCKKKTTTIWKHNSHMVLLSSQRVVRPTNDNNYNDLYYYATQTRQILSVFTCGYITITNVLRRVTVLAVHQILIIIIISYRWYIYIYIHRYTRSYGAQIRNCQ